ncbi:alpha-2-macroglobulin [Paucibacter sp. TC2R-5]|uniref:alpha-2-macroglobulin family protein n=1 Tax=Paucibacter sp. TC2R-5 TaxID=2893555 RepID=UPI0021E47DE0|nr:Ig-like domain-containing alpha-2-macroglobulin family protein [Paucibacter sp. TC2R-5]MCV2361389.1 alpha-2-macroglobulin [Paucibacter sp. TC2R-5]
MKRWIGQLSRRAFLLAAIFGPLAWPPAHAAAVAVSPSGEVAEVRQIRLGFSEPVVAAGDPRLPAPASLRCTGATGAAQVGGSGRWASAREWLFDLNEPMAAGMQCQILLKDDFKPLGGALTGPREFGFRTGAAIVLQTQPWADSQIEEDQHFLLKLNGSLSAADVGQRAWCEVEGLGERLPAVLADEATLAKVLASQRLSKSQGRHWLLHCQRPLPAGAKLQLVWSHGNAGATQRFEFQVRRPFTADFSCERERANAACIPVRPLRLVFSEPVARELALQVRLRPAGGPANGAASGAALAPKLAADDKTPELSELRFPAPLAENAQFTLELPAGLKDLSGRALSNAASFPLKVATAAAPPLAKFAAAPFGVLERDAGGAALLPITMRHVQADWHATDRPTKSPPGEIRIKRLQTDAEVLAWYAKLMHTHEVSLSARELGLPPSQWQETVKTVDEAGRTRSQLSTRYVHSREVELLPRQQATQVLALPPLPGAVQGQERPFEVIGLPLAEPGYHVVELSSAKLGRSLLDKDAAMYVRTGVLVTNLGVHFKWGRENSLVWVTTLDRGQPVPQADVVVNDCAGKPLWSGRSDAQGLAKIPLALVQPDWNDRRCVAERGFFITARKADADIKKPGDMAFVFSNWNRGIENWRFGLPTSNGPEPDARAHTVLDRSLLRAGETVSMKHFFRLQTLQGLRLARPEQLPDRVKLTHQGSGEQISLPLTWPTARSSLSQWQIPANAKLGSYQITLERSRAEASHSRSWPSGEFRVEEFRVPLIDARLSGPKALPVAPRELRMTAQLNYMAGGGLAQAPLKLSALLRPRGLSFAGFEDFSFEPPRERGANGGEPVYQEPEGEGAQGEGHAVQRDGKLVIDKLAGLSDRNGAAEFLLKPLPKIERASELLAELSYQDPNGETKTVAQVLPLWPSQVVLGLRSKGWVSNAEGKLSFSVLAVDTAGKPLAGQRIEVKASLNQMISSRKRMVGGFYAYDNRNEVKPLGVVCSGRSDDKGLLACEAKLDVAGEVELVAQASDAEGRVAQAASQVWLTRQGELWFPQDNDDRIDVLAEKKRYEPGETARLQVRMPFREATALVAVEREGVIETKVVTLRGSDPSIELKIDKAWAPNVYVSVLALRGRVFEVPWYSFFRWGWRAPVDWWRAFREGRAMPAPTAMVDLAKPSFKLGVTELQVGLAEHQLQVTVTTDKPQYSVRQTVQTRVKVSQDGRPLADAQVAFAAVDEGLLALRGNASWDLLQALIQRRGWGVETATAQSEIIGRRHYGRKAVAAGGGGGRAPTRELFDTLLLWRPQVLLDANGEAVIEVPLNDSLTSFRLVAVADAGAQKFGTGQASVRVTQDLQLLSGLPPLVREGDQFQAALTLRNSSNRAMKLRVSLQGSSPGGAQIKNPPAQDLSLAAGAASELLWQLQVPEGAGDLQWEAQAQEVGGPARDRLKFSQRVLPAVKVQVLQASLSQVDGSMSLAVAPPADAWPPSGPKRGGVNVVLQARLGGDLPGLKRFFETYPYSCLEQQTSQAIGLHDGARWQALMNRLPGYLDADGLANFFPPTEGERAGGSDRLTAYVLAAAHASGRELPAAARERMLDGLSAFVEGRLVRKSWSPRSAQLDGEVRRLAALEALARYGRVGASGFASVDARNLSTWPTAAVIDWLSLLTRNAKAPQREQRINEAQAMLRSRLSYAGTMLKFSNEEDDAWWWLMDSADGNAARLALAALDDPAWSAELPRMVQGLLARQRQGAWATTTANLWGVLALDKFAEKFESVKPAGQTLVSLGSQSLKQDWAHKPDGAALLLPWSEGQLKLQQQGAGKPWVTIQSLAAVPLKEPLNAGYRITRELQPLEQKVPGRWSRGDLLRVRLQLEAQSDMTWVVLSDPLPAGAAIMGSGLGGDSSLALQSQASAPAPLGRRPVYIERSFEAWRGYFDFLPRGKHELSYTVRLNNAGRFMLPGTRAEALYAPEQFGELPQAVLEVAP